MTPSSNAVSNEPSGDTGLAPRAAYCTLAVTGCGLPFGAEVLPPGEKAIY